MITSCTSSGVPRNTQTYPRAIADGTRPAPRAIATAVPSTIPPIMDATVSPSVTSTPPNRKPLSK